MARSIRTSTFEVATPAGEARLHVSAVARPAALVVLGHGAGRGVDTPDLLGLASALPLLGISVVLVDQPWVLAGRRVAAPPTTLDLAWIAAVADVRSVAKAGRSPLVVGGRSAGARVACRTAASVGAAAVVALAFPLVPPAARASDELTRAALGRRRPELVSPAAHGIPTVVVQGDRDRFGTPAEVRRVRGRRAGVEVLAVPGADHGFGVLRGGPDPGPHLIEGLLRAVALARGE